ncbi:MAG: VOC family protein [Candidatus Kariarchaeaceae archaeon]|jgi:predicted enzyme related to lactoylglutathione lyase
MNKSYISHVEIPVKDIGKAKEFFAKVFSWEGIMQDYSEEYVLVFDETEPSRPSFGLYKVDSVTKNQVIVTMEVEDIESTLEVVKGAGGEQTREKYEIGPEIGFAANFQDCFGNIWGLHSPPVKES